MKNLLFLCSRNRLRSPTAEQVFARHPGVETASAGLAPDAEEECSVELVERADIIFVMEKAHRSKLQRRFGKHLKRARVIRLDIPDDYAFMQPELVALLEKKVEPHLRRL
ncbi:low molecular weight protein tyrosine phosphatase family protein [Brevundimonas sp. M20]|uniref:low molecular weight protein tyrosine phosphatase family protein n=1 Tax=Brevundimonas sp. M20 TaxID=2591463 RepID=UPI00114705D1|nr:low molecular weight protein tyrosine phosphatase family protein [Brevundimonas sp. M20]QDH72972.1 phosphotyrosine protein phosphatase [Brevundimonas sp. M20]